MTPDPFPSELVEAAAKAAMEAEPGQNWECATAKEADVYLRDSLAVLAAVLPLIEQRVIDRLAREAGENPYRDLSMPLLSEACKIEAEVWDAGAACGVAAERARWGPLVDQIRAIVDEPLDERPGYGPTRARQFHRIEALLAALAPERTTGEGT